jgi:A/G-specific adenine glycosylase
MSRSDRAIAAALCRWFESSARALPWREPTRDGYRALVSEFMLQQTQVSRVVERYEAFLARFPDVQALARAREASVLAMWSGLGYYRRARLLHAAARRIVAEHAGRVPCRADDLVTLPGVGAYTAGAIGSIVFGERVTAVDGNVVRVLLRLEGAEVSTAQGRALAEDRALALVQATGDPGALNEGLMELGATVCTPRAARCDECPIRRWCVASKENTVDSIPAPAQRVAKKKLWCASVVVEDRQGRVLLERRAPGGLWSGLWQAPTLERHDRRVRAAEIAAHVGIGQVRRLASIERVLTHRLVRFDVYRGVGDVNGTFKSARQLRRLGMSNAQREVLAIGGIPYMADDGAKGGKLLACSSAS